MKIKSIIIALIILLMGTTIQTANATQLPKTMRTFLQQQKMIPSIRYDGVIVYGNDIMYIPVIPAYPQDVDAVKIVKTYPANQTMDKLPDLVIFNNNYSLIKVYRTGDNTLGVKNLSELPEEVKTGLIPQDMMVPRGLIFPENMACILGDVQIPLLGSAKAPTFVSGRRPAPLPTGKRVPEIKKENVPNALKNKLFFVNNFQTEFLEVFSSTVSEPLYSLKTSGVMKDVKPVLSGKYLLAATNNQKNLDVIDVANEYVSKHIDLTANPSEIAVDDNHGKAYVASVTDESLFVIDLSTMTMKEKIQLVGAPQKLAISPDGSRIAYVDMKTSNIYILDLTNGYTNKFITNYPNTSKIILGNNVLYAIARTVPKLRIVNFDLLQDNSTVKTKRDRTRDKVNRNENKKQEAIAVTEDIYSNFDYVKSKDDDDLKNMKVYSTSISDIEIGNKPVDMYNYNGIVYVLCAGDNTVYSYNSANSTLNSEKLPVEGFSKAFSPVPNSQLAIITNMSDLKYVVYDMQQDKALQTLPMSEYINTITVLERTNGQ
ncbi:hypothetical protein IJ182_04760 [bacterium]|nr:hypothetical protein [bacterium]